MNHLRKHICFYIGFMLISSALSAQNFYTKINLGYSAPMAKQSLNDLELFNFNDVPGEKRYVEQNRISFGQGFQVNLGLGAEWTPNLSTELNFSYLYGEEVKSEIFQGTSYFSRTLRGQMLTAIPSFVLNAPFSKKEGAFYSRVGLIISLAPRIIFENTSGGGNEPSYSQSYIMDGSVALGFNGALGVKWKSRKCTYFLEMDYRGLSYAPSKRKLTESFKNGTSNVEELSVMDKQTVFVERLTLDQTQPIDPNQPLEVLKSQYAFSSLGLSFGVSIDLF